MKDAHLSRQTLYAYHDRVLPAAEQRAVERHLATCAECQARLAGSSAIAATLKEQLGRTRAPQALRTAIRRQIGELETRRTRLSFPPRRIVALAAIATLALLLSVATFAVAFRLNGAPLLVSQLAEAHERLAQKPQRIQMQADAVTLDAWLEAQLHESITLPVPEDFSVIGGRMETIDGNPAAHVLYRQEHAAMMSLLVWRGRIPADHWSARDVNGTRFYVGSQGAASVVLWLDHDLTYACVAEAEPEALLALAARVWRSDVN